MSDTRPRWRGDLWRPERLLALPHVLRWLPVGAIAGVLAGTASAALLVSLDWATQWRESHLWIIALLPLGGLLVGGLYYRVGRNVEAGNNLLLDEIHDPKDVVPLRMAPLILAGTIASHLFGGSAGREGTALQMGASLADQLTRVLRLSGIDRRVLLMAGMSGGFASVFGTPLAGTVFGLEVLSIGVLRYEALFPCLVAALVGDWVTLAWGVHHTAYRVPEVPPLAPVEMLAALAAGAAFGLAALGFTWVSHHIAHFFRAQIAFPPLRPFAGGIIIAGAIWAVGTTKYIGLGIPTISAAFDGPLPPWDWAAKILFTAVTLGSGFKGGEVTPLFYIGATLGNALAYVLPLPGPLLAGMGFVGVFAGAANTPLASLLMGMELFGHETGVYMAIGCVASYLFSGQAGMYGAQSIGQPKYRLPDPPP